MVREVVAAVDNTWPPGVPVRHAVDVDLSHLAPQPPGVSGTSPPFVRATDVLPDMENFQLLLSARILKSAPSRNASTLLLDIGCNTGVYTWFWATLGFRVYCVDLELFGGQSGMGALSLATLRLNSELAHRITLFPTGVSAMSGALLQWSAGHNYARVASLETAKGVVFRTATVLEIMGQAPSVFLMKVDIDGGELDAIDSILAAQRAGRFVDNIIIELTPMWWEAYGHSFDAGMALLDHLMQTHDVYVTYWREASQLCCGNPFSTPPSLDWGAARMDFVQRVAREQLRSFLHQLATPERKHGQRDFWFRARRQPPLPGLVDGVDLLPLRCDDISLYASAFDKLMPCGRHHG